MFAGAEPMLLRVAEPGGRELFVTPRRRLVRGGRPPGGRRRPGLRLGRLGYRFLGAIRGALHILQGEAARRLVPGQLLIPLFQLGRAPPDFLDPQPRAIEFSEAVFSCARRILHNPSITRGRPNVAGLSRAVRFGGGGCRRRSGRALAWSR